MRVMHGVTWIVRGWVPGCAGMTTIGVQHAQSFKSKTCFGRTLHMKGVLAVQADKVFYRFG